MSEISDLMLRSPGSTPSGGADARPHDGHPCGPYWFAVRTMPPAECRSASRAIPRDSGHFLEGRRPFDASSSSTQTSICACRARSRPLPLTVPTVVRAVPGDAARFEQCHRTTGVVDAYPHSPVTAVLPLTALPFRSVTSPCAMDDPPPPLPWATLPLRLLASIVLV